MAMFGGDGGVFTFWSEKGRRKWPGDLAGWIFFPRAIDMLGQQIFDDWDSLTPDRDALPDNFFDLGASVQPRPAAAAGGLAAWASPADPKKAEAHRRMHEIRKFLVELFQRGRIAASYRIERTGELVACPPHWWNADLLNPRFRFGRVSPSEPMQPFRQFDDDAWLFVSDYNFRDMLERLRQHSAGEEIAGLRSKPPTASNEAAISSVQATLQDVSTDGRETEEARVASALSGKGFPIREVTAAVVAAEWNREHGAPPKVARITSLMKGRPGGRPKKN